MLAHLMQDKLALVKANKWVKDEKLMINSYFIDSKWNPGKLASHLDLKIN